MGWVEVWEWVWLGGGRVWLGWDSVQRAVVEGRVRLVGVELAQEWSWVGWIKGRYGGSEFGLGGESGPWRSVRMRSWVGGKDLILYGDLEGISGIAPCGYIHGSSYTIPIPHTPYPTQPTPSPQPNPSIQPQPFTIAPTLIPPAPLCPTHRKDSHQS